MTSLLRYVVAVVVGALNTIVPKRSLVTLTTSPPFDDTARAISVELERRRVPTVWLVPNKLVPPEDLTLGSNVRLIERDTLRGVWSFLRSRFVLFTHSLYGLSLPWVPPPPRRQTIVNLWHGMSIKKIGRDASYPVPRSTHSIAVSPVFQQVMSSAWGLDPSAVLVTGQPRTDRMLAPPSGPLISLETDFLSGRRLVAWLPTWRISQDGRADGLSYSNVFEFPDVNIDRLEEVLQRHDALLCVKPHPWTQADASQNLSEHVQIIDESWLSERGVTLYELLSLASILVSDVSSVWVDYLLLDRPIILAIPDLDAYSATRGLYFELPGDANPGVIVSDFDRLLSELDRHLEGNDPYVHQRRSLRAGWHVFEDALSSRRLLDQLGVPDWSRKN